MTFKSILFSKEPDSPGEPKSPQSDFYRDLNLNQIIDSITEPKKQYDLDSLFRIPLRDPEEVRYRQAVMQDLENDTVMAALNSFAAGMRRMRSHQEVPKQVKYEYYREGWNLEAALEYCRTLTALQEDLGEIDLHSEGLRSFREYLEGYVASSAFQNLAADTRKVKESLEAIDYSIIIGGGKFRVRHYSGEPDYSPVVEKIFRKFQQSDAEDYLEELPEGPRMTHIDAKILEFVSNLNPEPFAALDRFCEDHLDKVPEETIQRFDREIQFYIAALEHLSKIQQPDLSFCYPEISTTTKSTEAHDTFDLALAYSLRSSDETVVPNDFSLSGSERIMVVTGPNQGGKTTFARLFGQLHYLASLGMPVPGTEATLFLPDQILTHFEREENAQSLRGKLEDDLIRARDLLQKTTTNSIIILNEIFTSTTLQDAIFLSKKFMHRLTQKDVLGVWVTFLDEVSEMDEQAVSMVATVDPEDPSRRTFRIIRKLADGLAYARSLAKKHRLTSDQIKERLQ